MEEKGIVVDEKKIALLLKKIVILERTNLKTKQQGDQEMVRTIKKALEEEIECF